MKKLYDEIMEMKKPSFGEDWYEIGLNEALNNVSQLAKKYDDEIDRLNKELSTANEYLDIFWNEQ